MSSPSAFERVVSLLRARRWSRPAMGRPNGGLVAVTSGEQGIILGAPSPAGAPEKVARFERGRDRHGMSAHIPEMPATLVWLRIMFSVLVIVAAYVPLFPGLIHEWATFPSLSHGFAVPLIATYLVWSRRREIRETTHSPSWLGLPLVMLGLGLYVAGTYGGEPFIARISLPLTLLGGVTLVTGRSVAWKLAAGIAYLLFMVPLPYVMLKELTDQVRLYDATVTATVLPWLGVPVFQEGYLLHLPNMTLEVAEACSSIPAIASLLALGAAYGYVNRRRPAVQFILILSAVPLGLLSNIIRIIVTAAGVYFIGPIAIHNLIHLWNGTTVFLLTCGFIVALDRALGHLWREVG